MKTLGIALLLLCAGLLQTQAQVFGPRAANGAALGAVAGAIIGNNSSSLHHNAWKGAAIGAGVGTLIGAAADDARGYRGPARVSIHAGYPYHHRTYVARDWPRHYAWRPGVAWHRHHDRSWGWWAPWGVSLGLGAYPGYYATYPSYYAYDNYGIYDRPDYVTSGTLLGGIAGAIIGNNSGHHNAWRGAAIGAGAGMLLGSIAENTARQREMIAADRALASRPEVAPAAGQPANPQNVTIINNYYNQAPASPMATANAMFGRN